MNAVLRSPRCAAAVVAAAVVLAYADALGGPYQFDDFDAFVDVPAAHTLAAWWQDLGHGLRPLLKLSYLADWRLGFGAPGFHLSNLAIHLANALLVLALARRCLGHWLPQADAATRDRAALFAALVFALHPAQTEAVTYISGRSVSLMTLALLLALHAYLRQRWLAAGAAFVAAMAIKEPAAILPLLLCLIERCGPAPPARATVRRRRLAVFFAVPLVLGGWMLLHTRYHDFLLASLGTRTPGDNLLSQLGALRYLVELALGLRAPNIDPDLAEATQWTPALLAGALLLALAAAAAHACRRTRPWLIFAFAWFVIALLPTNSLLPRYDLVNDRQLYLASIGPLLGVAAELAARRAFEKPRALVVLPACAALCVALLLGTRLRNDDYRSEIALWRATVAASPGKARPWNNLGYAYQLAGCGAQARLAYEQALAIDPGYLRARDNLLVLSLAPARRAHCA
ncbi:glycosyltransferase 87 family protein [Solimonas soli]|uniref:glycosyltransferase 87 family protein n=1 Tax=Solimonas soli TaxID=413479 RepID=UPI000481993C|nr:glycosyltransferase 87 family protein [Solimonas soli]